MTTITRLISYAKYFDDMLPKCCQIHRFVVSAKIMAQEISTMVHILYKKHQYSNLTIPEQKCSRDTIFLTLQYIFQYCPSIFQFSLLGQFDGVYALSNLRCTVKLQICGFSLFIPWIVSSNFESNFQSSNGTSSYIFALLQDVWFLIQSMTAWDT